MLTTRGRSRIVVRQMGGHRYCLWSAESDEPASSRSSTQSPQTVRSCPHDVEAVVAAATLGCRGVSHTPTYDQLRGERINADVPASETDPQQVDPPGKHRLRDDAPAVAAVGGFSPGPGADLAEGWSWFTMVDSDRSGKHFLRENTPGAVAVSGCSPRPGADLAAYWSWFGTPEPVRAGRATTTRSVHPFAETLPSRADTRGGSADGWWANSIHRSTHRMRLFCHQPPRATASSTRRSVSAATRKPNRCKAVTVSPLEPHHDSQLPVPPPKAPIAAHGETSGSGSDGTSTNMKYSSTEFSKGAYDVRHKSQPGKLVRRHDGSLSRGGFDELAEPEWPQVNVRSRAAAPGAGAAADGAAVISRRYWVRRLAGFRVESLLLVLRH
jgi:hypothetical protein